MHISKLQSLALEVHVALFVISNRIPKTPVILCSHTFFNCPKKTFKIIGIMYDVNEIKNNEDIYSYT